MEAGILKQFKNFPKDPLITEFKQNTRTCFESHLGDVRDQVQD